MLSFDKNKFLDRLRERIYSKQDPKTGVKCPVISEEKLNEYSDIYHRVVSKMKSTVARFVSVREGQTITSNNDTPTNFVPAYHKEMEKNYTNPNTENFFDDENPSVDAVKQIREQSGIRSIGTAMAGSIFHWSKDVVTTMFNTFQKNSIMDNVGEFFSTTLKDGSRALFTKVSGTVQRYRKRLRATGERDDDGNLYPLEGGRYKPGTREYLDQKMAHQWEGILAEKRVNSEGEISISRKEWISDEETWQKVLDSGISFHDEYDEKGNLINQLPKQLVQSLHSNIDGAEVRSAITKMKEEWGTDIGKLFSKKPEDQEIRSKILQSIGSEEVLKGKTAKYKVFIKMLESREYPRTLNNTMQVVVHGREKMHKYLRVHYEMMAKNKLDPDIVGVGMDLSGTNMGRSALISQMAKMHVARKMWKEVNGADSEPTLEEISKVLHQGITIKGVVIRPSSSSPSKIPKVTARVFDAFQANLKKEAQLVQGAVLGGKKNPKYISPEDTPDIPKYLAGEEGYIQDSFLRDVFGIAHFQESYSGLKKGIEENGDEIIKEFDIKTQTWVPTGKTLNQIITDLIAIDNDEFSGDGRYDEQNMAQVTAIRKQIAEWAYKTYSNTTPIDNPDFISVEATPDVPKRIINAELIKDKAKRSEYIRKQIFSQQTGKTIEHDNWFKEYKGIAKRLNSAFDADSSFSSEELEPGANQGFFNKSLDLFTALQVHKLEFGATSSSGGSAFMFEDHHIYGKGDNQANTHFAMVFKPAHQGGLHATNYLIEDYDTALQNLDMMKKYVELYLSKGGASLPDGHPHKLTDEFIAQIQQETPGTLRDKYDERGKLMPGMEVDGMTIVPTDKGSANIERRKEYGLDEVHSMFTYPPMSNEIIDYYDNVINKNGDEIIPIWGNESRVKEHKGTFLGEAKEVKNPKYISEEETPDEIALLTITPPHPLWKLGINELNV